MDDCSLVQRVRIPTLPGYDKGSAIEQMDLRFQREDAMTEPSGLPPPQQLLWPLHQL